MSDHDEGRSIFGGRYELQRHIARGGMAEVYLARDVMLDRPVALKVLFPELGTDRSFVERFRREAQAAANLSHPNIVSVYDYGEEDGYSFIVMEYVDGRPLSQVIRSEGPLLPDRAADIGADVAAALSFAHRNGVIHRDVKPGNVLIDGNGQVKVTDFGIARAKNTEENLTQTGAVMGTATYFSPEQATGAAVDPRSDVYSLGVVLYEMVVGRPPFRADNPMAIALKHVNEQPTPPRALNPDVPPAFEAIALQAIAKNPADRYASAEELRADLLRYRQGRPIAAAPTAVAPTVGLDDPTVAQRTVAAGGTQVLRETPAAPAALHEPEERRSGVYVALLLVLLAVLGVLLFLLGRSLGVIGGPSTGTGTTTVPFVVGMSEEEARGALSDAGLEADVRPTESDKPAGEVLDQDPKADAEVEEGTVVTLLVSAGATPVEVPDVVGDQIDDALDVLERAGFVVVQQSVPSDDVEPEHVVAQAPRPGEEAPKGSTVTLQVSSGRPEVTVPDVVGDDVDTAFNKLADAGFRPARRSEASASVPEGHVIRTDPPPGDKAERGATVTMFVSTGPDEVEVPDVRGMSEAAARAELQEAGFRVSTQQVTVTDPSDNGRVVAQDPAPGTTASRGSTVVIRVGRAPVGTSTTSRSTTTTSSTSTTTTTSPTSSVP